MSEPSRPPRPGRSSRPPSPASLGIVRVDADFEDEYPGGDATCTEAYASLVPHRRSAAGRVRAARPATFGIPQAVATALAVIDEAGAPLTPSQVSDRVLVASATMTATLDLLERRGWIRRIPNPADRRSSWSRSPPRAVPPPTGCCPASAASSGASCPRSPASERAHLLDLLAKILDRTAEVAAEPPEPLHGQRNRPARLSHGPDAEPGSRQPPAPSPPHPSRAAEEPRGAAEEPARRG